jgi:hypothetical protein
MDRVARMLLAARSRYSAGFLAAIQWGLAIEESKRPQSVQQWRGALLHGAPVLTGAAPPAPRADDTRKYVWMSLGVLIFFLFVAGADILQQRAEQQRAVRQATPPGEPPAGTRAAGRTASGQRARPSQAAGLTREEFTQNLPHLAPKFPEIDTDASGYVSTEELQSYLRRQ